LSIHCYCIFTAESKGEKILKIGQHLPKLWAIKLGVVFYETRCTVDHRPRSSCSLPSDAHDVLRLLDAWRNRGTDLQPWHQFIRRSQAVRHRDNFYVAVFATASSVWSPNSSVSTRGTSRRPYGALYRPGHVGYTWQNL